MRNHGATKCSVAQRRLSFLADADTDQDRRAVWLDHGAQELASSPYKAANLLTDPPILE